MHKYVLYFETKYMFGMNLAEIRIVVWTLELQIYKLLYLFNVFSGNIFSNKKP